MIGDGFSRYLIGSGTHPRTLELEAEYADSHDDLAARVFLGGGADEVNNFEMAASRIVTQDPAQRGPRRTRAL